MNQSLGQCSTNIGFVKKFFKEAGVEFTESDGATLNFQPPKEKKKRLPLPKGKKGLNSKQRRNAINVVLKHTSMSKDQILELNNLWKTYIQQYLATIIRSSLNSNSKNVNDQILRLDLIGADVIVKKSKYNPNLIGFTGVIIFESKNIFRIASSKDYSLKTVLKDKAEFILQISDELQVIIFGSHFLYKPVDRAVRKYALPSKFDIDTEFLIDKYHG